MCMAFLVLQQLSQSSDGQSPDCITMLGKKQQKSPASKLGRSGEVMHIRVFGKRFLHLQSSADHVAFNLVSKSSGAGAQPDRTPPLPSSFMKQGARRRADTRPMPVAWGTRCRRHQRMMSAGPGQMKSARQGVSGLPATLR